MRKLFAIASISTISLIINSFSAFGQETLTRLTYQDVPRGFLGEAAARKIEPGSKGVGVPFLIPGSMKDDVIYGIDISHHTFADGSVIKWDELKTKRISFVYIKASEGELYYDGTFQKSWKALTDIKNPPLHGAYHFLRALDDPRKQADTFIKVMTAKSNYAAGKDLPPVVDLEWDCKRDAKGRPIYRDGRCAHDNWSDLKPAEIVTRVNAFVSAVKEKFGVAPVIYTSTVWWNERNLSDGDSDGKFLAENKFWIADYTKAAQKTSIPPSPAGKSFAIWQFTDNGKLTDKCNPSDKKSNCMDTNAVLLSMDQFRDAMGLAH